MKKETFRGKSVLFCGVQQDAFVCDLFCMIDDAFADSSILRKDEICNHHFTALLSRLCTVAYCNYPVNASELLLVALEDSASSDSDHFFGGRIVNLGGLEHGKDYH